MLVNARPSPNFRSTSVACSRTSCSNAAPYAKYVLISSVWQTTMACQSSSARATHCSMSTFQAASQSVLRRRGTSKDGSSGGAFRVRNSRMRIATVDHSQRWAPCSYDSNWRAGTTCALHGALCVRFAFLEVCTMFSMPSSTCVLEFALSLSCMSMPKAVRCTTAKILLSTHITFDCLWCSASRRLVLGARLRRW